MFSLSCLQHTASTHFYAVPPPQYVDPIKPCSCVGFRDASWLIDDPEMVWTTNRTPVIHKSMLSDLLMVTYISLIAGSLDHNQTVMLVSVAYYAQGKQAIGRFANLNPLGKFTRCECSRSRKWCGQCLYLGATKIWPRVWRIYNL